MKNISTQWLANVWKTYQLCPKGHIHHTVTNAYAHLHAFTCLLCSFACYFTKISILIHTCVVCFHLSTCVCLLSVYVIFVCVCACMRCPLSGSFDLFNASNGTSKEDFSEFDSLRSSSSVPTGTHPCLRLSNDTESVLFFLSVWNDACLQISLCAGTDTHVLSLYVNITRPEQRQRRNHQCPFFSNSWWFFHCKCNQMLQ